MSPTRDLPLKRLEELLAADQLDGSPQARNNRRPLSVSPPRIGPIGPLGLFSLKSPVFSAFPCGPVPGPISAHLRQNRPTPPAHLAPFLTACAGIFISPWADWAGCCAIGPPRGDHQRNGSRKPQWGRKVQQLKGRYKSGSDMNGQGVVVVGFF